MQTLGTVIKLSGDSEVVNKFKIIIVERFIQEDKNNKLYYDYKGVFYPMGSIEENKGIMFNEKDIEEIWVEDCEVGPWFNEPGGGQQYFSDKSISELLDDTQPGGAYIKEK